MELQMLRSRAEAQIHELEDKIIRAMKERDRAAADALARQRARVRLELSRCFQTWHEGQ